MHARTRSRHTTLALSLLAGTSGLTSDAPAAHGAAGVDPRGVKSRFVLDGGVHVATRVRTSAYASSAEGTPTRPLFDGAAWTSRCSRCWSHRREPLPNELSAADGSGSSAFACTEHKLIPAAFRRRSDAPDNATSGRRRETHTQLHSGNFGLRELFSFI